jgi:SAM-dependent methyltransferase
VALVESVAERIRPDEPTLESWYSRYRRQHGERIAMDLEIVERHVGAGAHILEYGAIPLLMTAALETLDYTVSGIDIRPERFAAAIEDLGLEVVACDVETDSVPFADETFDALLFNELFEHLRINPIFTLTEARRVLKPHGTLLLSTPNLRSFRGVRNLLTRNQGHAVSPAGYEQYEKLTTLGHMGHVREYTTREVADFLTRIGFSVQKVIYRGGYGRGLVGLAEQIAPSFRPFFSMVATRNG